MDRLTFLQRSREDLCILLDLRDNAGNTIPDDDQVVFVTNAALSQIESVCSRNFIKGRYAERKTLYGDEHPLTVHPVIAIESVEVDGESLDYELSGNWVKTSTILTPGDGKIVYSAGSVSSADLPVLHTAIVEQAAALYNQRELIGIARASDSGPGSSTVSMSSSGISLIKSVAEMIEPLKSYSAGSLELLEYLD